MAKFLGDLAIWPFLAASHFWCEPLKVLHDLNKVCAYANRQHSLSQEIYETWHPLGV